ncbi:MAG: hypothetical protein ABI824_02800 [Acidobacteriota bacterium]
MSRHFRSLCGCKIGIWGGLMAMSILLSVPAAGQGVGFSQIIYPGPGNVMSMTATVSTLWWETVCQVALLANSFGDSASDGPSCGDGFMGVVAYLQVPFYPVNGSVYQVQGEHWGYFAGDGTEYIEPSGDAFIYQAPGGGGGGGGGGNCNAPVIYGVAITQQSSTTGYLEIYGSNLSPLTNFYVSNASSSVAYESSGQVNLYYSNAPPGYYQVQLTTACGASNADQFQLTGPPPPPGDPTPVITGISPSTWQAGECYCAGDPVHTFVAINGSGFGAYPSVYTNATGLSGLTAWPQSDTLIYLTFSVDPGAPYQPNVSVSVTSGGVYGGNGFVSTGGSSPTSTPQSVVISGTAPPLNPRIFWNGLDKTGATLTVVVGEAIVLTGSDGTGQSLINPRWSPGGAILKSFDGTLPNNQADFNVSTSGPGLTFHFYAAGQSVPVGFFIDDANGYTYPASIYFNIVAPIPSTTQGIASGLGPSGVLVDTNNGFPGQTLAMHYGNGTNVPGISFFNPFQPP